MGTGTVGTGTAGTWPRCLAPHSCVSAGLCSEACLLHRSHCDSPPLLRAGSVGKNKLPVSKKVTQQLSKTTTRSLGDLKVCRGTRGLVARFLQRPKRNPAAAVEVPGHSPQGHKQVGSDSWGVPVHPSPAPLPQGAPRVPSPTCQHLGAGLPGVLGSLAPCGWVLPVLSQDASLPLGPGQL